ncbi:hypothetical protein Tco_0486508 [Tanacetum coccineum]
MEAAADQCSVDNNVFEIQVKQLRIDNDQLLNQIMSQEIVHIVANYVDICDVKKSCVNDYKKCPEIEIGLFKKKDFVEKEAYDKLVKSVHTFSFQNLNATRLSGACSSLTHRPIFFRLKNNRDAHEVYIEKTIEYTDTLRGFVESASEHKKSLETLYLTCPSLPKSSGKLVVVTPINKDKRVRFAEPVTSSNNIPKQTDSLKTKDSNKPLLTSTGVKPTTSASGSKPSGNTKNNRITRPPRSNQKNKVEDHPRKVKSSLNKTNSVSEPISNALVKHSVRNAKFESMCAICNKCLFDANHDMCLIDFVNDVNVRSKSKSKRNKKRKAWKPTGKVFTDVGYKWKPTGRFFTIVGSSCPLTRITPKKIVHLKETTSKSVETPKPEIKVYSRRPKQIKSVGSSKKAKIVESKIANNSEPTHLWGSNATDVPSSSSLVNDRLSRSSSGPGLQVMTPTTSRSGLVPNIIPQQPCNPPKRDDWDTLFQPLFDEYFNPPTIVVSPIPVAVAPRAVEIVDSHMSTSIDQDVPSSKDHPIANVIGDPYRSLSTRKQLKTDAMWCYFDAFLTSVEPKNFKQAMTESSWINAMSRQTNLAGVLKNKARLVDQGFRQEEGIDFEESFAPLKKALYGLKQALRAWYDMLSSFLISQHFSKGAVDPTLFTRKAGNDLLLDTDMSLTTYSDEGHVGCQDTRRSTSGSAQFLGDKLVSWSSKKQKSTAISNYGFIFNKIPLYCENKSAIALCCNNVQHSRAKHIDVHCHFIKEQVENGIVKLYFVRTKYQLADIFTKLLPRDRFIFLIEKLAMRSVSLEMLKPLTEEEDE